GQTTASSSIQSLDNCPPSCGQRFWMAQISPPRLKTAISSAFTRINFAPPSGISLARSFAGSGSLPFDGAGVGTEASVIFRNCWRIALNDQCLTTPAIPSGRSSQGTSSIFLIGGLGSPPAAPPANTSTASTTSPSSLIFFPNRPISAMLLFPQTAGHPHHRL